MHPMRNTRQNHLVQILKMLITGLPPDKKASAIRKILSEESPELPRVKSAEKVALSAPRPITNGQLSGQLTLK